MMDRHEDFDWEGLFQGLLSWKEGLPEDPSVTLIAQHYKKSPWAVLVSTILSLRTKDEVTLPASRRVLERAPNPASLLALSEAELAVLAYPAGFYKTKAKNLRSIARILLDSYDGQVPRDLDTLLSLPGVGRKTANLVITEAYGLPGICVDTHVHRITNRLGLAGEGGTANPEKTEILLRDILPKQYWIKINYLLVLYGQRVCRPISPRCSVCVIRDFCARMGVDKSR